jgi:hypothetical protein
VAVAVVAVMAAPLLALLLLVVVMAAPLLALLVLLLLLVTVMVVAPLLALLLLLVVVVMAAPLLALLLVMAALMLAYGPGIWTCGLNPSSWTTARTSTGCAQGQKTTRRPRRTARAASTRSASGLQAWTPAVVHTCSMPLLLAWGHWAARDSQKSRLAALS